MDVCIMLHRGRKMDGEVFFFFVFVFVVYGLLRIYMG